MTVHVIYKQIEKRLSVLEERRCLAQSRFDRIKWGLSYETDDEWFADHKAQPYIMLPINGYIGGAH